jgi:hypothetical protein
VEITADHDGADVAARIDDAASGIASTLERSADENALNGTRRRLDKRGDESRATNDVAGDANWSNL